MFFDNEQKRGDRYEEDVAKAIERYFGVKVYRNLLFNKVDPKALAKATLDERQKMRARETEADMAFVTKKGVFMLECKSREDRAATFYGSRHHQQWQIEGDYIMNPFDQNYKHIMAVRYCEVEIPADLVHNIVVTNANFEFTSLGLVRNSKDNPCFMAKEDNGSIAVIIKEGHGAKGIRKFKDIYDGLPEIMTDNDVLHVSDALSLHEASKKERKAHARYQEELEMFAGLK